VVRRALHGGEDAVVEDAHDGGARHHADIGHGGQFDDRGGGPEMGRLLADPVGLGVEAAAQEEVLVGEDDAGAGAAGGEGGHQARGARADHQEVAVKETLVVEVGVGLAREAAEARGAADGGLVDALPEGAGPHEGLVVEARRQERGKEVVYAQRVEGEARPAVLASGIEAVEELGHGGAGVGLLPGAGAQLHEGVGLLRARRQEAAGAVVLEAPAEELHAAREERGGQRVAGVAGIGAAVEGEAQRAAAVDAAAGEAVGLRRGGGGRGDGSARGRWCRAGRLSSGSSLRAGHVAGELGAQDLVGQGVAGDDQPGAVAPLVEPQLPVDARGVVAEVQVVVEGLGLVEAVGAVDQGRVAEIGELLRVARAEEGWGISMAGPQCRFGWAPWPFSSIIAPRRKRSSR
jgi:hypothetical protein